MSSTQQFKYRHFLPEIVLLNVCWYCHYRLGNRNLEEMMLERWLSAD